MAYALLDTASSKTLCKESLVKELGITAPEITYHITTATNKREEIHGVQLDLQVGAIEGGKTMQFSDVWSKLSCTSQ